MYRLGEGGLLAEHVDGRRVLQLDQLARDQDHRRGQVPDDDSKEDEGRDRLAGFHTQRDFFGHVEVHLVLVEVLVHEVGHGAADEGFEEVRDQVHRRAELHAEQDASVGRAESGDHAACRRGREQLPPHEGVLGEPAVPS